MRGAGRLREMSRRRVIWDEGGPEHTIFVIRQLRGIHFATKGMMVLAASDADKERTDEEQGERFKHYIEENPEEYLDTLRRQVVTAGLLGMYEIEEDDKGTKQEVFVPLTVVDHATDNENEIYHDDLGIRLEWLYDQISQKSRMTKEDATTQDSFRREVRPNSVSSREDVSSKSSSVPVS